MNRYDISIHKSGFTLVELLVVIAIISVLVAMVFPELEASIQQARLLTCANNQREVARAALTYSCDARDAFPPSVNLYYNSWTYWPSVINNHPMDWNKGNNGGSLYYYLGDYLPSVEVFYCTLGSKCTIDTWQSYYENMSTTYQVGSFSMLWNYGSIGPKRSTDTSHSVLTADFMYCGTSKNAAPYKYGVMSSHPLYGGQDIAIQQANAYGPNSPYWQIPGGLPGGSISNYTPPLQLPVNASFIDGHVAQYDVEDLACHGTTYGYLWIPPTQ